MKETLLRVPDEVRYISDWKGFNIPSGHAVLDKVICGCGLTQWCLGNQNYVILCSPRKVLLENKAEQNPQTLYFKAIEVTPEIKKTVEGSLLRDNTKEDYEKALGTYLYKCQLEIVMKYLGNLGEKQPPKFLVTYDSFPKLLSILRNLGVDNGIREYKIVVDEFQLIFNDACFKADVGIELLGHLQNCSNVCYVSATPMMKEYLVQMPEFKDLPYITLDWGNRAIKADIKSIQVNSVDQLAADIIKSYLDGNTETRLNCNGIEVISKEAVLYMNNINLVISLIKKCKLREDQVNLIIADNPRNLSRLKSLNTELKLKDNNKFKIGHIPLKGEQHKMFTFCTSTAYCGVDFYSTCAKTYVFSNCSINTMALDISLDLPQILGRQRLPENPWHSSAVFVYTTNVGNFTEEEIKAYFDLKMGDTNNFLEVYRDCDKSKKGTMIRLQESILTSPNRSIIGCVNYVGFDPISKEPVLNNLIWLAEKRALEVQKENYASNVSVNGLLGNISQSKAPGSNLELEAAKIMSLESFEKRFEALCDWLDTTGESGVLDSMPQEYSNFVSALGTAEIRASGFRKALMIGKIEKQNKSQSLNAQIKAAVQGEFEVGSRYSLKEIKETLQGIYDRIGYQGKAKTTDLGKYLSTKECKIKGTREKGLEILGVL